MPDVVSDVMSYFYLIITTGERCCTSNDNLPCPRLTRSTHNPTLRKIITNSKASQKCNTGGDFFEVT